MRLVFVALMLTACAEISFAGLIREGGSAGVVQYEYSDPGPLPDANIGSLNDGIDVVNNEFVISLDYFDGDGAFDFDAGTKSTDKSFLTASNFRLYDAGGDVRTLVFQRIVEQDLSYYTDQDQTEFVEVEDGENPTGDEVVPFLWRSQSDGSLRLTETIKNSDTHASLGVDALNLDSTFAFTSVTGSLIGFDPVELRFDTNWVMDRVPNFENFQVSMSAPMAPIPEPGSLLICVTAALTGLTRRRRANA